MCVQMNVLLIVKVVQVNIFIAQLLSGYRSFT